MVPVAKRGCGSISHFGNSIESVLTHPLAKPKASNPAAAGNAFLLKNFSIGPFDGLSEIVIILTVRLRCLFLWRGQLHIANIFQL